MFYLLIVFACTITTILSIVAVIRVTRAPYRDEKSEEVATVHAITVLKPLCGADDALESNLETFFKQDYPDYEILFGVEGDKDPAIQVVRCLQTSYPDVKCKLVIHNGKRGLNPKVSNLRAMLENSTHDMIVISDSNIAVAKNYLDEMNHLFKDGKVGLVTNLFCGKGERTIGAIFENLHLNGPVVGGIAGSQLNGRTVSVGKSMMFRRSVLQQLGGMESVAALLAEDYVIGRMFRSAGYKVRLSPQVVDNICVNTTVKNFLRRHLRWGLIRSRLMPFTYLFEILANPIAIGIIAPIFGFLSLWPILWAVLMIVLRDSVQWVFLRGAGGLSKAILLGPLKELLMIGVWIAAPFLRYVAWRGRRFRISAGTRMYADSPNLSVSEASIPGDISG